MTLLPYLAKNGQTKYCKVKHSILFTITTISAVMRSRYKSPTPPPKTVPLQVQINYVLVLLNLKFYLLSLVLKSFCDLTNTFYLKRSTRNKLLTTTSNLNCILSIFMFWDISMISQTSKSRICKNGCSKSLLTIVSGPLRKPRVLDIVLYIINQSDLS